MQPRVKPDSKRKHIIALYGNVSIPRAYCPDCQHYAFVLHGRLNCCERVLQQLKPKKFIRLSSPYNGRRLPPQAERDLVLSNQDGRCFYCEALFGDEGYRNNTPIRINMAWDHQVPFAYSQDNHMYNFVAACQVCNGIKSSMIFQTVDEAKVYLALRREEKGYDW